MIVLAAEYDVVVRIPSWLSLTLLVGGPLVAVILAFIIWRLTRRKRPPPLPRA